MRSKAITMAAVSVALFLAACGGDDNVAVGNTDARWELGETYLTTLTVDDETVLSYDSVLHALKSDGSLTTDRASADAAMGLTLVPVSIAPESLSRGPRILNPESVSACLRDLVQAFGERPETAARAAIRAQLEDQDIDFSEICADYLSSGLGAQAWVDFYEALDEFNLPASSPDLQEADLLSYLRGNDMNAAHLLAELERHGMGWRELLSQMQDAQIGFHQLTEKPWLEQPKRKVQETYHYSNYDPTHGFESFNTFTYDRNPDNYIAHKKAKRNFKLSICARNWRGRCKTGTSDMRQEHKFTVTLEYRATHRGGPYNVYWIKSLRAWGHESNNSDGVCHDFRTWMSRSGGTYTEYDVSSTIVIQISCQQHSTDPFTWSRWIRFRAHSSEGFMRRYEDDVQGSPDIHDLK